MENIEKENTSEGSQWEGRGHTQTKFTTNVRRKLNLLLTHMT